MSNGRMPHYPRNCQMRKEKHLIIAGRLQVKQKVGFAINSTIKLILHAHGLMPIAREFQFTRFYFYLFIFRVFKGTTESIDVQTRFFGSIRTISRRKEGKWQVPEQRTTSWNLSIIMALNRMKFHVELINQAESQLKLTANMKVNVLRSLQWRVRGYFEENRNFREVRL